MRPCNCRMEPATGAGSVSDDTAAGREQVKVISFGTYHKCFRVTTSIGTDRHNPALGK
jgi:hypothetical protein